MLVEMEDFCKKNFIRSEHPTHKVNFVNKNRTCNILIIRQLRFSYMKGFWAQTIQNSKFLRLFVLPIYGAIVAF
jgi:hypothetical protein